MPEVTCVRELLHQLVEIPSVNPDGDPGTPHIGEQALADYLARRLRSAGARVRLDMVERGRPNLLAVFPCRKPTRRVLFAPHTDTVSVRGMTIEPFAPTVRHGRLYGRGACDTKGPMAAMLCALLDAQSQGWLRDGCTEFHFAGLMGEEAGNVGAVALAQSCVPYDLVIVGEPTDNRVVHAHKSCVWMEMQTRGRAVHASAPERGRNAITAMMQVVHYLEFQLAPRLAAQADPVLGASTTSIGKISGGSKANIVPESCQLTVDFRLTPQWTGAALRKMILQDLRGRVPGLKIERTQGHPALWTDPELPIVREILPHSRGPTTAPWFCDAAIFANKGMPAIALGPGSIRQAHTADEWISLRELDQGVQMFSRIIRALSYPAEGSSSNRKARI